MIWREIEGGAREHWKGKVILINRVFREGLIEKTCELT